MSDMPTANRHDKFPRQARASSLIAECRVHQPIWLSLYGRQLTAVLLTITMRMLTVYVPETRTHQTCQVSQAGR